MGTQLYPEDSARLLCLSPLCPSSWWMFEITWTKPEWVDLGQILLGVNDGTFQKESLLNISRGTPERTFGSLGLTRLISEASHHCEHHDGEPGRHCPGASWLVVWAMRFQGLACFLPCIIARIARTSMLGLEPGTRRAVLQVFHFPEELLRASSADSLPLASTTRTKYSRYWSFLWPGTWYNKTHGAQPSLAKCRRAAAPRQ